MSSPQMERFQVDKLLKQDNSKVFFILRGYKLFGLIVCAMIYLWQFVTRTQVTGKERVIVGLVYMVLLYKFEKSTGGYSLGKLRIPSIVFSKWTSLIIVQVILMGIAYYSARQLHLDSHILSLALAMLFTLLWTIIGNHLTHTISPPLKTVVVYDGNNVWDKERMRHPFPRQLEIIDSYDINDGAEAILSYAGKVDVLYLYRIPPDIRNELLKFATAKDLFVYVVPRLGDLILNSYRKSSLFQPPVLRYCSRDTLSTYHMEKRVLDIVVSCIGLLITSPLLLLVAILIKIEDRGPIFYRQVRLTQGRKEFEIIKFRSMTVNAEADGVARLSTKNDPRTTRVGKWIRKLRIDEIPQLINVLKGEMSIVGPRPERPDIAQQYEEELPEFSLRLLTKAGITGYAQVFGKYNTPPYDKLQMDLMYILNQSLWEDIKLIILTPRLFIVGEDSTEGVNEDQVTAMKSYD
ncbi:MAG: sugar transferase [Bacillota bacterium]|nr:sugar transferase [Bacillota bacterium]